MNAPRKLRVAVIGTGFVGPHHVDAIRRGGYGHVVALGGVEPDQVEARARALGIERSTTDVPGLMADPEIDVVHICTPNGTHVALAAAAIDAGKHVVVEKPLALNAGAAWDLVRLAQSRHLHAMVCFTYRGYPMVRQARQLVQAGELGPLRLVHGRYLQDWLALDSDYNWRIDPRAGGPSRAIADIGAHWFDTVEFVTGLHADEVFAELSTFIRTRSIPRGDGVTFGSGAASIDNVEVKTEDAANLLFRFGGGARGGCLVSQVSHGHKNDFSIELTGAARSLAWRQESPEQLWVASRDDAREFVRGPDQGDGHGVPSLPAGHPEGWGEALRDVLKPFYAAISAGEDPEESSNRHVYPTLADGARAVDFVEAALLSAERGQWTRLPDEHARTLQAV